MNPTNFHFADRPRGHWWQLQQWRRNRPGTGGDQTNSNLNTETATKTTGHSNCDEHATSSSSATANSNTTSTTQTWGLLSTRPATVAPAVRRTAASPTRTPSAATFPTTRRTPTPRRATATTVPTAPAAAATAATPTVAATPTTATDQLYITFTSTEELKEEGLIATRTARIESHARLRCHGRRNSHRFGGAVHHDRAIRTGRFVGGASGSQRQRQR